MSLHVEFAAPDRAGDQEDEPPLGCAIGEDDPLADPRVHDVMQPSRRIPPVLLGTCSPPERTRANKPSGHKLRRNKPGTVLLEVLGDDEGIFGCMTLLGCEDSCPKDLPHQTKIAFLRRRMVKQK